MLVLSFLRHWGFHYQLCFGSRSVRVSPVIGIRCSTNVLEPPRLGAWQLTHCIVCFWVLQQVLRGRIVEADHGVFFCTGWKSRRACRQLPHCLFESTPPLVPHEALASTTWGIDSNPTLHTEDDLWAKRSQAQVESCRNLGVCFCFDWIVSHWHCLPKALMIFDFVFPFPNSLFPKCLSISRSR